MSDEHFDSADFQQRTPSPNWEQLTSAQWPGFVAWYWVKPPTFPHGVAISIPQEIDRTAVPGLTVRSLLEAIDIKPQTVLSWAINGVTVDAAGGQNPLMGQPLPAAVPGVDSQLFVLCQPLPTTPAPPPGVQGQPQTANAQAAQSNFVRASAVGMTRQPTQDELECLEGIDEEWHAALAIEGDLQRQRKKVVDMAGKLKSLTRDLSADERTYSGSQDKRDWQDARRWLRDCEGKLTRCLKEYDIGFTSKAGQRAWFERTYENFVEKKLPFEGMDQAYREYQINHKTLQTLNATMKNAVQHASQNGERRARRILATINEKVRRGNTKSSFLGAITGS